MAFLGWEIQQNPNLVIPYYLHNPNDMRETLTREGAFSFPLAVTGFMLAGPVGVVVGHVVGAGLGYVRHQRVHA